MTQTIRKSASRALAALFLVVGGLAVTTAVGPASPASATCNGVNVGATINPGWAVETWNSGTCDSLGDYRGNVRDGINGDGCVYAQASTSYGAVYSASACSTTSWTPWNFNEADESAPTRVCRPAGCTGYYANYGF